MNEFNIIESFPCVIRPKNNNITLQGFLNTLMEYKNPLQQLLLKKGAILFRDFPVITADDFATLIETLNLGQLVNYIGGDSPRDKVMNKVYTSTEAPPSVKIALHQELSYIKKHPKHIYFFCDIAPTFHGETIIADARKVYAMLDPNIIKKFSEKKLTYISHYYHKSVLMKLLNKIARSHKSWIEVFETENKQQVESICEANDIQWQWLSNEWIETKQIRPALLQHPITQETVWFNQAHLYDFNPKLLGMMKYLATQLVYFRQSFKLHDIKFGDHSPIPRRELYHIMDVLDKNTIAYPWQSKDVMILDNVLAMHGRAPFKGNRRILTALTM